jgi:hypothetical protein
MYKEQLPSEHVELQSNTIHSSTETNETRVVALACFAQNGTK